MNSPARYQALDGWRGVCALGVALFHLSVLSHITVFPLVRHAYLLVDFFFALSGFIIAHTYFERIRSGGDALIFLVRRIGRLWPLHVAMLAALAGWELLKLVAGQHIGDSAPFSGMRSPAALVQGLFLVHAWGASHAPTWNSPSWSISVELAACVVFAIYCLLARAKPRLAALALAAIGLVTVIVFGHTMNVTCDYGVFRGLAGFFLGVLVRLSPPLRLGRVASGVAEAATAAGALGFLWFAPQTPVEFAAPLVFALMVWVFASEGGSLSALLTSGSVQSLGRWSYSVYLVHFPLIVAMGVARKAAEHLTGVPLSRLYPTADGPVSVIYVHSLWAMDGLAVAYLVVLIALSAITYRLIEEPGRTSFNNWARDLALRPQLA